MHKSAMVFLLSSLVMLLYATTASIPIKISGFEAGYAQQYPESNYDDEESYSYEDQYQQPYEDPYQQPYEDQYQQSYDNSYDDAYSKYPTKDKKFECPEGPFKGFFVANLKFCDVELPEGPQGPPGIQGPPGNNGTQGPAGPAGITFLNNTNVYRVNSTTAISNSAAGATATANCTDQNDFAISGDALILNNAANINNIFRSEPTTTGNGWKVTLNGGGGGGPGISFQAVALCFDNPPVNTLAAASTVSQVQHQEDSSIFHGKDSSIIPQAIGNSPKLTTLEKQSEDGNTLTAMEKITKLKTQWLNQLQ